MFSMRCNTIFMAALNALLSLGALGMYQVDGEGQTASITPISFDVVSIKPSDPNRPELPNRIGPASFTATATLRQLIMSAYGVHHNQIVGGPIWSESEFFDVQAKAEITSSRGQITSMLQTLLVDRFGLKLHRETRTVAGYVMGIDKNGPNLPPSQSSMSSNGSGILIDGGEIWVRGLTMKDLALGLWTILRAPVLDETKIDGNYDFKLRLQEGDRGLTEDPENILPALHDFGLRLQARKIPVEVLVIDYAERPSEN